MSPASESGVAQCTHCGLPVRNASKEPGDSIFCCLGCRFAASVARGEDGPQRFLEARLLVCAFLAMGVMTFSLVLYGEAVYAVPGTDDPGGALVRNLGRFLVAFLSLFVLCLLGIPLLIGAAKDARAGKFRMDGLIAMAILAAFGLSLWNTIFGGGEVYFETATMVLVLVMLGRRLESHARVQGRDAARALDACLPTTADVVGGPRAKTSVAPSDLLAGDRVLVLPGGLVPADGRVARGESDVTTAHLTGESAPRHIAAGSEVWAGAINGNGLLEVDVSAPAREGSIGRIQRLLDAPLPDTRTLRVLDRVAAWLGGLAVILAVLGGTHTAISSGFGAGLRTALSVLLVACPCALGLATPLAYRAVRAALAKNGVLVHDAVALEVGARVDAVLLDKTGTLTSSAAKGLVLHRGDQDTAQRFASLLTASGHPIARALDKPTVLATEAHVVPGQGVFGRVADRIVMAGRPEWLKQSGISFEEAVAEPPLGDTVVAYAEDGHLSALASFGHRLRPGAKQAMESLARMNIVPEIVSGDAPTAVAEVAAELGIPGVGGILPEGKVQRLEGKQRAGHCVLVVGDGLNDAPMLRKGDVSITVSGGTELARSQAQVELVGDLSGLPLFLQGARELRNVVRGNLAWTIAYNAVALLLAAAGRLHPLAAVSLMIVSSLLVSVRSYRLLDFRGAAR